MSDINVATLKPTPTGFNVDTLKSVWGEVKDVGKYYIAAKHNYQSPAAAPATAPQDAPQNSGGKTLGDALAPLVGVYAADQAIQRTNKNPPYIIYAGAGIILAFTVAILYRPKR